MPLVDTRQMLLRARKNRCAVGAFNIENMEMAQAVLAAAQELSAPVILQTTPSTVRYGDEALFAAMVRALAEACPVPVALHLDHGGGFAPAARALRAGYTSVMIDGSALPFEENVALSARVVEMAAASGVPVEAELGTVGGKEDDTEQENRYTDPAQALDFVTRTGVQSLAVAIGTAHGPYAGGVPELDVPRLRDIRARVEVPLVLHGASGLRDDQVRACIDAGVCKVNFATELRIAYSEGVKAVLAAQPDVYDPKKYGAAGRQRVTALVKDRMRVCGLGPVS